MKRHLGIGAALLLLVSCSSNKDIKTTTIPADSDPGEQIALFEQELASAKTSRVDVLSPTNYSKAVNYLREAKDLRAKEGKYEDIFAKLEKGKAELSEATKYSKVSDTMLEGVADARANALKKREEAEKAGATDLDKIYGDADDSFMKLTKDIEANKIDDARARREEVIKKYQAATGLAEKKQVLDPAKKLVKQADDEDAKKYAPKAFSLAEKAVESTEKFAENNPTKIEEIRKKGEEANFYAKRALNLTRQSKSLAEHNPEDAVLWMESRMSALGTTLHVPDQRSETLDTQFQAVAQATQKLEQNNRGLAKEVEKTSAQVGELSGTKEQLEAQRVIEAKFASVQKEFDEEEAEVIRQGDKLIVRLKGIQFPTGKSTIPNEQFGLLAKVQKAIEEFGEPAVVVEGHTDSVGSAAANKKLSKARADAVKNYLAANEAVTKDRLKSEGVGFDRPIASNKTKEGRAQNRRIDVVIQPSGDATAE